ncbi:protein of unknown function [Paraburkholderia kururiensis]
MPTGTPCLVTAPEFPATARAGRGGVPGWRTYGMEAAYNRPDRSATGVAPFREKRGGRVKAGPLDWGGGETRRIR